LVTLTFVGGIGAAGPVAPGLGAATSYAVLAADRITNVPTTTITGDLGLHPGTSVTGAPVVFGTMNVTNQAALDAKNALRTAYLDAEGRSGATLIPGGALGGLTLGPGLYKHETAGLQSLGIASGETLVLNGSAADVWIFQTDSTLIAETSTTVRFQGGAQACNVFWQVGSAATLRAGSKLVGTVMAHDDITLETGATVLDGRLLAGSQANGAGALVLDTNTIKRSDCATVVPPVDTTPVATTPLPPTGTTPTTTTPTTTTPAPSTAATAAQVQATKNAAAKRAAAKKAAAKKAAAKKKAAAAAPRRAATSTSTSTSTRGNAKPPVKASGFTG
jgi:type VI secretion system secreted protein VgrG